MASFETRRFRLSIAVGVALTVVACGADQLGLLSALDHWFNDVRASYCQFFCPKPDDRIVHVDIDDASLEEGAIGRWPWSRGTLAQIIEEIGRAKPAAIALDLHLIDPETPKDSEQSTGPPQADPDTALVNALADQKNMVLAVTFDTSAADSRLRADVIAQEELTRDLELELPEFSRRIVSRGVGLKDRDEVADLFVRAIRLAVRDRVGTELRRESLSDDQLRDRLLPHLGPGIKTPTLAILKQEAAAFRGCQQFRRFGLPVPNLPVPVVSGQFTKVPLPMFADKASYSGFVDYDHFDSATVRMVPLVMESDHLLYPQFGLAIACAVLGVDVKRLRVEADRIIVPNPNGPELRIPTHSFHSSKLGRNFSGIIDIPWFGSGDWQTMYDWPSHQSKRSHISANLIWDIHRTIERIGRNNSGIDDYIQIVLGDGQGDFRLDPRYASKYAKSSPPADDFAARVKAANFAMSSLEDAKVVEDLQSIPAADRSEAEKGQLTDALGARDGLKRRVQDNAKLISQLGEQRSSVAARLAGKGVILGWTAEGESDVVNTSLSPRCPGVVVHGLIAESVLSGHWWYPAPAWVGPGFVLLLGFATSFFVAQFPPLRGVLATLLLMCGYLFFNGTVFFDLGRWLVPVAGPVVTISVVWSGCTLQRVIFEGIERNRVATEVAIISREMALAHKVQAALIPLKAPEIPGLEAEGWTLPADATGGDCYDLWQTKDGRLAILVADASGHGLAPAMIVSQVRTLLRALSELNSNPCDLLTRVNTRVAEDLEPGRFVTAFLGFLSPDGLLEYASAGHGPQFWYERDGSEFHLLDSTGAPLGMDTTWLCDDPQPPIQIAEGGTLALFSDGIFEAMDPKAELFGVERLHAILNATRGQGGKVIIQRLTAAVLQWQQKPVPGDDQTIVVARRVAQADGVATPPA